MIGSTVVIRYEITWKSSVQWSDHPTGESGREKKDPSDWSNGRDFGSRVSMLGGSFPASVPALCDMTLTMHV